MNVTMKVVALFLSLTVRMTVSDLVLSKAIMELTLTAAELSTLAYEESAPDDTVTAQFSTFGYYDEEPDQALTVKTIAGYCFVAFRGTSLTWDDWSQNLEIGKSEICHDVGGTEKCCTSRVGFYKAYDTSYRSDVEKSVRECAATCEDKDECVVITGHSQGGAIAAVAGLLLADLNPYVITFGQPATIEAPCDLLTSERIFRFVNTKATNVGIAYDPVPMAPGLGADHFGNMIVLSDDDTGVAFIGLDAQDFLHPYSIGVEAHFMVKGNTTFPGYEDRILALMARDEYPIQNNGFVSGSLCSENKECYSSKCGKETMLAWSRCVGAQCEKDRDCDTGRCDSGICVSKTTSCGACDEDSDCAGKAVCLFFMCSNEVGLMDNNCVCRIGHDCESGRCEGTLNRQCEARLSEGASCNEDSDCKSDYCSWSYLCEDPADKKKGLGATFWVLIGVVAAIALYLTYKFVNKGDAGYSTIVDV